LVLKKKEVIKDGKREEKEEGTVFGDTGISEQNRWMLRVG
jgi:hypothetical protein